MKSGMALDRIIQEQVMGLRVEGSEPKTFPYSSNLVVAWSVLEKLYELGWSVDIVSANYRPEIRLSRLAPDKKETIAIGKIESVPHGICLAALRALDIVPDIS